MRWAPFLMILRASSLVVELLIDAHDVAFRQLDVVVGHEAALFCHDDVGVVLEVGFLDAVAFERLLRQDLVEERHGAGDWRCGA